jgi:pyruvate dehydrogenase E2 component (dihydrolipoamide acetyltransferase)
MADTVNMPKLGFDMSEGTLVRWVKAEGEQVNKGDVLAEIETDKATVEVESNFSGTVLRELVDKGSVVPVGSPIAIIGQTGEKVELPQKTQPSAAPAAEAEKTAPAPAAEASAAPETVATAEAIPGGELHASPLARRMARESQLDLSRIQGSGPGGRIVRRDIEAALQAGPVAVGGMVQAAPAAVPAAAAQPREIPAAPLAPVAGMGVFQAPPDEVIPTTRLQAAVGRRMVESKQQAPHFYVTHEYDVEALTRLRQEVNALLPEEAKITINDFIVKAVGLTLRQYPGINASLDGDKIVRHGHINVGVAVPVQGGLMTIVSRDTDVKPLRLLSQEIRVMVERARSGKVRPEDIEGSTFSTSNLGMYDVDEFSAILNPPEAGILAIGTARKVPVVDPQSGEIVAGVRMKATISVDHRVTDGAEAARFMQALAQYLETPVRLLL